MKQCEAKLTALSSFLQQSFAELTAAKNSSTALEVTQQIYTILTAAQQRSTTLKNTAEFCYTQECTLVYTELMDANQPSAMLSTDKHI